MTNRKTDYKKSDSASWEKRKASGAPPVTTPGDKRAFDARPKASDARSRYEAPRPLADSEPSNSFDSSDSD